MRTFKIGDRVRRTGEDLYAGPKKGDINVITSISPCGFYVRFDNRNDGWVKDGFELVAREKTDEELAAEYRSFASQMRTTRKTLEDRGFKMYLEVQEVKSPVAPVEDYKFRKTVTTTKEV